jgi:CSLREA domain-containing protein
VAGAARFGILVTVVCAAVAFAAPVSAATLTVATTFDTTAGDGSCSLREAIIAANTPGTPGPCGTADALSNTIVLRPGKYALTIVPTGDDDAAAGDLDVDAPTPPVTIVGAGVGTTTISGATLGDRVLSVAAGANATVEDLTISGGHAPDGARRTDGNNMNSTPPIT